jgi:hypothetical protein
MKPAASRLGKECWEAVEAPGFRDCVATGVAAPRLDYFPPCDRGLTPAANTNVAAERLVSLVFDRYKAVPFHRFPNKCFAHSKRVFIRPL